MYIVIFIFSYLWEGQEDGEGHLLGVSRILGGGDTHQYAHVYNLIFLPITTVPARVMSFSKTITTTWKEDVVMDCLAVGDPRPTIEWRRNR